MAGAGYKSFSSGDILTASDVNTYLMQQTVMVFDNAAARTSAIAAPSEGMMSYLKDTNKTYRYDGSSWLDDAGLSSPLTTKGDLWTYTTTDARLAVGTTNGHVLQVDSTASAGMKWAAAPAASLTIAQIASGSLSGTSVSISSLSSYDYLIISFFNFGVDTGTSTGYNLTINSDTGSNYNKQGWGFRRTNAFNNSLASTDSGQSGTSVDLACGAGDYSATANNGQMLIILQNCKNAGFTTGWVQAYGSWYDAGTARGQYGSSQFIYKSAAAVSSVQLNRTGAGNFNSGTYTVWGA